MRFSCKASVEFDLQLHYKLRDEYIRRCSELKGSAGTCLKRKPSSSGKFFYDIKRPGQSRYMYIGDDTHPEVRKVREYKLYEKTLEVIQKNILAMEDFLDIYRRTNADSISELLTPSYKLPRNDCRLLLEPDIDKWLKDGLAIRAKHPEFDPANKKVTAFDGTKMRSRAECIHHEAFFIYNVPSIYELPYKINGEVLHPDFTALDVYTMTPKMMEHHGSWFHSNPTKRNRCRVDALERWDQFKEIGFFPESNLLLTFGSDENNFDIQAIHRKIAMLASPPPSQETIDMLRRM